MKTSKSQKRTKAASSGSSSALVATATAQRSVFSKVVDSRRIVHRELVATVNGSVAFAATSYSINPGFALTFPWLSTQASGWEQYRFNKLNFEFVTRTATTTLGSVILSPDYDPLDPPPLTEAQATNSQDSVEDAPWKNIVAVLNPTSLCPKGSRKLVRSTRVAGDPRSFDSGTFFLCTLEEIGTSALGKLWVSYDIDLYVPQTAPTVAVGSATTFGNVAADQTLTTATPAEITWTPSVDALRVFTGATQAIFVPPAGAYNFDVLIKATNSVNEAFAMTIQLVQAAIVVWSASFAQPNAIVLPCSGYFVSSGTNSLHCIVTLTGPTGVLKVIAGSTFRLTPA